MDERKKINYGSVTYFRNTKIKGIDSAFRPGTFSAVGNVDIQKSLRGWAWYQGISFRQWKIFSRRTLDIVASIGLTLSAVSVTWYLVGYKFIPPVGRQAQSDSSLFNESAVVPLKQEQTSFGLPVRLKIPAIEVDSSVESVGLASSGAMDTPKNPDDVAWLNPGTRPGETGNAVITGHYGIWKNGRAAVFNSLRKLNKGDELYIEDDKGASISFVVREIRSYAPDADTVDIFGLSDEKSHLNLITCEGSWNKDTKSYSERLVIFSDRE